jgi:uncharacterized protein YggE
MEMGLGELVQRPVICTVTGNGSVRGEFDRVSFSVSIVGTGSTSTEAKQKVKEPLAAVQTFIKLSQEEHGVKFAKRVVSPFSVCREDRFDDETDEMVFSHYEAKYSLTFVVLGTEHTTVIMDELTDIDGIAVSSPVFQIGSKQREELKAQALELAVKDAKATFEQQCRLLDKNPENYEVYSWSQNHFGGTGITGSTGSSGVTGSAMNSLKNYASRIVVNSGEANVQATISLSYTHNAKSIMSTAKTLMELAQKELLS